MYHVGIKRKTNKQTKKAVAILIEHYWAHPSYLLNYLLLYCPLEENEAHYKLNSSAVSAKANLYDSPRTFEEERKGNRMTAH